MKWEDVLVKYGREAVNTGKILKFIPRKSIDKIYWQIKLEVKVAEGEEFEEEDN